MICFIEVFSLWEGVDEYPNYQNIRMNINVKKSLTVAACILFTALYGVGQSTGTAVRQTQATPKTFTFTKLEIIHKPAPGYTEDARENRIQGNVKLNVVFKANGQIGDVSVLQALSHGLTERAVEAAKKIRFKPKAMNGQAMEEQTTVEYVFSLYFDDEDENAIRTKVAVLSAPRPDIDFAALPTTYSVKLDVKVFFPTRGDPSVFEMPAELSSADRTKIGEAVRKIKFRPAVHKNGSRVSVTRVVSYAR